LGWTGLLGPDPTKNIIESTTYIKRERGGEAYRYVYLWNAGDHMVLPPQEKGREGWEEGKNMEDTEYSHCSGTLS